MDCPRCQNFVVVPPQSAPQAEKLYRALKNKHSASGAPSAETRAASIPTWEALGEDIDDVNMPLWMEGAWMPPPEDMQEFYLASAANPVLSEELAVYALEKRHKFTVTLLSISLVIAFVVGIIFGVVIHTLFVQPTRPYQHREDGKTETNIVTGTLYYRNEHGERRADVDAVVVCLPKNWQPGSLLSCQGLRPEDVENNDTVQLIREKGMYERTDANGSFTFQYQEGVRYFVILISANQKQSGEMKPSVLNELRRYFRDPEQFGESCISIDEYEWSDGKHSLRHTFESAD